MNYDPSGIASLLPLGVPPPGGYLTASYLNSMT